MMINVEELPNDLEQRSANQVKAILESFIDNGVQPEEINLGFFNDGKIAVEISGSIIGTIIRTFDGETVDATFTPGSLN